MNVNVEIMYKNQRDVESTATSIECGHREPRENPRATQGRAGEPCRDIG